MSEILTQLGFLPTISKEVSKVETWSDIYKIIISGTQYDRFMETFYPGVKFHKVHKSSKQSIPPTPIKVSLSSSFVCFLICFKKGGRMSV